MNKSKLKPRSNGRPRGFDNKHEGFEQSSTTRGVSSRGSRPKREHSILGILTPREHQIATLACTGITNKEIGRVLGLSEGTIKQHIHSVFRKLGIKRRMRLREFPVLSVQ